MVVNPDELLGRYVDSGCDLAAAGLVCVAAYNTYTRDDDLSAATLVTPDAEDPAFTAWFRDRLQATARPTRSLAHS